MAIFTVGTGENFASITAAIAAASTGDTINLINNYSGETAIVAKTGLIFNGAVGSTGIAFTLQPGVALFTATGMAAFTIVGSTGTSHIIANDGGDTITIVGGANVAATIDGGAGNDRLIVDFSLAGGAVTATTTSFTGAGMGTVSVTAAKPIKNFTLTTGAAAGNISLGNGDNVINAGDGANNITVGDGNNTITAGIGADTITVGGGANSIDAGDGINTITAGNGDNTITAGIGADTITVGGGANSINAGDGANTITAGDGNNLVTSFAGADTFSVGANTNAIDSVAIASGTSGTSGNSTYTQTANYFLLGTRILTDRGEVAVEDLVVGGRVATLLGGLRPIDWIDTQSFESFDGRVTRGNAAPVRFDPGSLGAGLPHTNLFVSPAMPCWWAICSPVPTPW